MLCGHRRRLRRRLASGRGGRLPHGQHLGQQQRDRRRSEPDGRARHHPAACAGGGGQHERAGTHWWRLRLCEQQGAGGRRSHGRPLARWRRHGNRRTLDSLRRREHAGPVSQQFASRRPGTSRNHADEQQRRTATHRQQHAAVQAQSHTGTSTSTWRIAQPRPRSGPNTQPRAESIANPESDACSNANPESESDANACPNAHAEPIASPFAVRKLPRRRSPPRAPP
ncbi:hypothetical protein R11007_01112 [Ralstonia holmesii]|nr:hypothetical protein R11007_01112 [Ralstonia sp. LMG 32967]